MDTRIVTLEPEQTLSLPVEAITELGLRTGSRLAVTLKDGVIVLQPLLADSLAELRGIFSSDIDLVAELQQERRQDKW
jgi:antitoxin component of MazEF toxin-antitoxin module